ERFERRFEDGYRLDPKRIRERLWRTKKVTRGIVITDPHNPSGVVASREAIEGLAELADEAKSFLLVDRVYRGALAEPPPSAADLAGAKGATVVTTTSLTKAYGLSGLRCGWIVATPEKIERILRARDSMDATGSVVAESLAVAAFR